MNNCLCKNVEGFNESPITMKQYKWMTRDECVKHLPQDLKNLLKQEDKVCVNSYVNAPGNHGHSKCRGVLNKFGSKMKQKAPWWDICGRCPSPDPRDPFCEK